MIELDEDDDIDIWFAERVEGIFRGCDKGNFLAPVPNLFEVMGDGVGDDDDDDGGGC